MKPDLKEFERVTLGWSRPAFEAFRQRAIERCGHDYFCRLLRRAVALWQVETT